MVDTRRLLTNMRKRATSAILGHCEQAGWYRELTTSQKEALRSKVLETVGVYHDNMLDLIRALEGDPASDGVTNEKALELLEAIWDQLRPEVDSVTVPGTDLSRGRALPVTAERPFLAPASGG